ncbi:hypothetical protein ACFL54_02215 [Planctomycetota bacterium]
MFRKLLLILLITLIGIAGCSSGKKNRANKNSGGHGDLHLVSLSPEETFQSVRDGILAGDLDEVFKYYSFQLRLVENREGLENKYRQYGDRLKKRFNGANIIPGSMQYMDEKRAACRIKWGTGEITGYSFVLEKDGWKLGREIIAVTRD